MKLLTAAIQAVYGIVALVRELFQMKHDADQREAGRNEVTVQQQKERADAIAQGKQIAEQADAEHIAKKDDSAFDPGFWRD